MERLHHRKVSNDANCPICNGGEETIIHALFECPNVKGIWECSGYKDTIDASPSSSFKERWDWIHGVPDDEKGIRRVGALAWGSWLCRNKSVFDRPVQNNVITAAAFLNLVEDYVHCASKINTDAYVPNNGMIGLGAVIRDDKGMIIAAGVKKQEHTLVEVVEAHAAYYGITLARRLGFHKVWLECDAWKVATAVKSHAKGYSPIYLILNDICKDSSLFDIFHCSHVKRSGNVVAHLVARWETNGCDELKVDASDKKRFTKSKKELDFKERKLRDAGEDRGRH
ncbi:hypothetical protein RDABS01_033534 [Bienertia sinuspersici]